MNNVIEINGQSTTQETMLIAELDIAEFNHKIASEEMMVAEYSLRSATEQLATANHRLKKAIANVEKELLK